MTDSARYSAYDLLDVPILVVRTDGPAELVYANPALERLVGVSRAELKAAGVSSLIDRFVGAEDRASAHQRYGQFREGGEVLPQLWVEVALPRGLTRLCVRAHQSAPGERVVAILDAPGLVEARQLSEALVQGTPALLRSDDEPQVLRGAVDLIERQGLWCAVLVLEGDHFVHSAVGLPRERFAETERMYGAKMEEIRFPLSRLPHLQRAFETRRATFHPDVFAIVDQLHREDVAAYMRATQPSVPALDAPLFVDDAPYGALVLMGPSLTRASVTAIEQFAQLLGSAIERARHSRRADQRLGELQRLQQELVQRERLASLGEAAAVVAHEVRNPLGAIINAVAVLRRDAALLGDSAEVVRVIAEESRRLDRLVGDLLAFARPFEPRRASCDLAALLPEAMAPFTGPSGTVPVELAPSPAEAPVSADPELLMVAVHNLLRNAVQASPRGGTVRVELSSSAGAHRIDVHDEGKGIPDGDRQKVFAPFFTTRATGTGLGLAIVDRIAKAHGGRVVVSDSPYGGACFSLELPASAAA